MITEEVRLLRIQPRVKSAELGILEDEQENELPNFLSFIPFLPPLTSANLRQYYTTCFSLIAGIIIFRGLLAPTVLKNGAEVKLQRNVLTVLEPPIGYEDGDYGFDEQDNHLSAATEFSWDPSSSTRSYLIIILAKKLNTKHVCFTGAQSVGMGVEALKVAASAELYNKAKEISGFDILDICINGLKEKLDSTVLGQAKSMSLLEVGTWCCCFSLQQ